MHGLIRVRQFTLSEGHLILRPDQLEEEFSGCLDLARFMLETLGLLRTAPSGSPSGTPTTPANTREPPNSGTKRRAS